MQRLIDSVELFCGCTGHEIKTKITNSYPGMEHGLTHGEAIEWTKAMRGTLKLRH
jgi:hypothetical protein